MADPTPKEDVAFAAAVLAYIRTMHQEAVATIVALEAERARVSSGRRAAQQAPRPQARPG
jgi:hypothetical protein